jgi:hypothetical protein
MNYYVYALIDPRNNLPFYIGKGKNNRCYDHLKETKETTKNIRKYYKIQYLKENCYDIPVIKLYKNLDEETAYYMEEVLIWKYGRKDYDENGILTNICETNRPPVKRGEEHPWWGRKHTEDAKEKNRIAHTGLKYIRNEDYRKNISKALKNKPKSEEHKRKLSDTRKGYKANEQTKIAISNGHLGLKYSEEHKKAISIALQNHNVSESTKTKISKSLSKRYKVTSPEGKVIIVEHLLSWCKHMNVSYSCMNAVSRGIKDNHKGWKCEVM